MPLVSRARKSVNGLRVRVRETSLEPTAREPTSRRPARRPRPGYSTANCTTARKRRWNHPNPHSAHPDQTSNWPKPFDNLHGLYVVILMTEYKTYDDSIQGGQKESSVLLRNVVKPENVSDPISVAEHLLATS
ncbi:hypothetical protein BGY98DRAFT_408526 [Russula aff. rugulosa BPL654]|nr:hypothetical protein BGY98DRAFT_408526 [Russula aff. rugulosa BPL654]